MGAGSVGWLVDPLERMLMPRGLAVIKVALFKELCIVAVDLGVDPDVGKGEGRLRAVDQGRDSLDRLDLDRSRPEALGAEELLRSISSAGILPYLDGDARQDIGLRSAFTLLNMKGQCVGLVIDSRRMGESLGGLDALILPMAEAVEIEHNVSGLDRADILGNEVEPVNRADVDLLAHVGLGNKPERAVIAGSDVKLSDDNRFAPLVILNLKAGGMDALRQGDIFDRDRVVHCTCINLYTVNIRLSRAIIQAGNGIGVGLSVIVNISGDGNGGRVDIGDILISEIDRRPAGGGICRHAAEDRILHIVAAVGAVKTDIVDIERELLVDVGSIGKVVVVFGTVAVADVDL